MLRAIRENSPATGLKLVGINFADPNKQQQMTTIQQWEKIEKLESLELTQSTQKIRYPIKMAMEIPTSISFIAFHGKPNA